MFRSANDGAAVAAVARASHRVSRRRIRPNPRPVWHHASVFAIGLAATPDNVTRARQEFKRWLRNLPADTNHQHEIVLAFSEAVTNAIEHGSRCDGSQCVLIRATVSDRVVTVSVKDSGRWISVHPNPAERIHRGRGLLLIGELANGVDITCTAEGTEIVMRFDLPQAA